jgi:hypothetical protein
VSWQLTGTYFENCSCDMVCPCTASAEQAAKLRDVFSGQLGGPMALITPLIGEMLGLVTAPIEYVDDGRRHALRVRDLIDVEIEDFIAPGNPKGEVERLTGMFHPANSTLTIAKAARSNFEIFGLSVANEGRNGHWAPFFWSA